jgi:hypothetical protein
VANDLIHANGGNGITVINPDGGPHYVVDNTIHASGAADVRVTLKREVYLVKNIITGNGVAAGLTGGRFRVTHQRVSASTPGMVQLLSVAVVAWRILMAIYWLCLRLQRPSV